MPFDPNSPVVISSAVKRMYSDLPELMGESTWQVIQPQFDGYIEEIEAQPDAVLASIQLSKLLWTHDEAHKVSQTNLVRLKCVATEGDSHRIIEKYTVKG